MRHPPNTPQEWLIFLGIFAVLIFLGMVLPRLIDRYRRVTPQDADEQQLFTESAAFRSRWQYVQLWQVPYGDLAAEASRCGQILAILEQRQSGPVGQPGQDELTHQIAWYRGALDAVQRAMAYISAQGAGPQYPPR